MRSAGCGHLEIEPPHLQVGRFVHRSLGLGGEPDAAGRDRPIATMTGERADLAGCADENTTAAWVGLPAFRGLVIPIQ